ncbi:MAG: transporter substrate-binding domain-containing protein [Magnetococcales bacterium]|nr:transporter substrate-binding domain-containing protein [Magnetococcales bacterium]
MGRGATKCTQGWWPYLLAVWLAVMTGGAMAADPLSLVVSDANPILSNKDQTGILDTLVKETFRQLDIPITITPLPSERAITNANTGMDDGDLLRIGGLSQKYPNLIQVQEKWMDMEFSAFTRHPRITISSWQDLTPYTVGMIRGWKVFENSTSHVAQRSLVVNAESLFALLLKDRVDVILYDRLQGEVIIQRQKLSDIRLAGKSLTVEPLYLYMNKKHATLVPQIEEQLRKMKADGSHARLTADALRAALQ